MAFRQGEDLYYIRYEMVPAPRGRVRGMPMSFSYDADPDWQGERSGSTREEIGTGRRTSTLRTQDEIDAAIRQARAYEKGQVYSVGDGLYVKITSISKFNPASLTDEQWAKISETERWSVEYLKGKYGGDGSEPEMSYMERLDSEARALDARRAAAASRTVEARVDIVVAAGKITGKGKVDGGTGWAVEGALLRGIPVYVYDQPSGRWYTASSVQTGFDGWTAVDAPPTNVKAIAGIGTRSLSEKGYGEIMAYVKSLSPDVIIHSGGAGGSDAAFEQIHQDRGGTVVSHSFEGHDRKSKAGGILVHSASEMDSVEADVKAIGKSLGRPYDTQSGYIQNLLKRNMFQIEPGRATQTAGTPENTKNLPDGVTKFHPTYGEVKVGETEGKISRITLADGTDRNTLTANLFDTAEAAAAATVAQGTEQGTSKPLAAGSNPAGGATTADGTPLPQPQGERPIAEIVAERLNEFADMRATSASKSRFSGGKRTTKGRRADVVSSMMDRSVGAAGVFGESYESPGEILPGIDKGKTIQSRLSALFQSIGYTPDENAGEFLKGKLVPTNDLVAEVMGEMISAIKLLNRPNSPLTPEHRAELGAIVLELSRILHDAGDPRTRRMFEKLTKKPMIGKRPNNYFGTVSEGADVFYPGGAEDPFAGKVVDAKGKAVEPDAMTRRIAAAEIGQVPSSSMGEEPSVTRSLALDQTGVYDEVAGMPAAADPIQVSRLQKAVDEIGVYDDPASLQVEVDVKTEANVENARQALRSSVNSDLAALLEIDSLLSDVRAVSSLRALDREGGFGAPLAFKTDVPYRSNLFTRTKPERPLRKLDVKIPDADTPSSLREAELNRLKAAVEAKLAQLRVALDAIEAKPIGGYTKEGVYSTNPNIEPEKRRIREEAAAAIKALIAETSRRLPIEKTVTGTLDLLEGFESVMDMPVGERTVEETIGYAQENLISGVKMFNRRGGTYLTIEVRERTTIPTPDYILAAEAERKARVESRYSQLVQDYGEDFARAFMKSDEGAVIFSDKPVIGDTITLEPGSYLLPERAIQAIATNLPTTVVIGKDPISLSAGIKVAPKYIVLKNGSIVSSRSGESGFISHRRVLPFRVREVRGGIFPTGTGSMAEERRYEIEKLDPNSYESSDPSVRNDASARKEVIRKLELWYGGEFDLLELERRGVSEEEIGTLVTDLEEIIAADAYSALEILAMNGDSFPDLEAELLRAIGDVHGDIRLDRMPQYAKTKLASVPVRDTGGLRGATVKVKDAVRVIRPGIPQLESKTGVDSVADILNRETSAQAPTVVDDSTAVNSIRRGVSFLYRLAHESAIQLGYGGAKKSRRIIISDVDSAASVATEGDGVIDQINDAGLLAARAAVESAKAILHAGWSEGLDPKYSRTRFDPAQEPVGTIRQAPEGQTIPAGSKDTQEAARRIRRYIPGMEDVGIPLSPTETDSALYIMRASGALGDKATKFFNRYFEQAGLLDPKNQDAGASVNRADMTLEELKTAQLFEGFSSEDAVQIISEMEASYRSVGSVLRTGEQTPIEFRVLERETPEEATLRVLRAVAAVDEKGRAQRKVQAKAAPATAPKARNVTTFDATDGLTEEGVIIDQLDDYSWSDYGDDDGFTPVEGERVTSGNRRLQTMNAKRLSKLIAFKLNSLGGISEEGVRSTLKQIMLDEEIKGILPTSKEALDKMFVDLYKDLSGRLQSQVTPNEMVLVRQLLKSAGSEYIGPRLLRVAVNAEPDFEGRPQLDIVVQSDTGKVQKIRVTEKGKGLVAAQELLPLLRQTLEAAAVTDLETIARPLYEALYEAAPIAERPESIEMPSLPKGDYAHGPFGRYVHNVISAIEAGRVPVQEVDLPDDLGEELLVEATKRSEREEPASGLVEVDSDDMDVVFEQQYDQPDPGDMDDDSILMSEAINQGKLATLLRPDQGFSMLSPGVKKFDMRLRTPLGGGAAGAAIDIGMAAAGGYLTPENALLSAGLNATNLLSKSPLKAGLIGSGAALVATAATGGDIGRTIFGIAGSIAGGVLGGAFTGGIGAFGGSVGGSLVADEVWKSLFGQQQNAPVIKPFSPGVNAPQVRFP